MLMPAAIEAAELETRVAGVAQIPTITVQGGRNQIIFRGEGFLDGAVVDFIDFDFFPSFNVADAAISVGAALLIVDALFFSGRQSGA